MSKFVDLSHPIEDRQVSYPKDPTARVTAHRTLEEHGCHVSQIVLSSHHGTHLDAPFHFIAGGRTLDEIPLERFFGPASLVDLAPGGTLQGGTELTVEMFQPFAEAFQPGARVIYRTGWSRRFGQSDYFTGLPSLTADAAGWMAERRIGLLGMDTPTPSTTAGHECHHILLADGVEIVLVEGLTNLSQLPDRFTFAAFPLNIKGRDGSPVRAVGIVE